ncbi:MAG: DUF6089 family protein [Saprospiraceae bacterium]
MQLKSKFIVIVLISLFSFTSRAQSGFELGGWVGLSHYFGDLNTSFKLNHPGPAAGANARLLFNERLALKSSLNIGYIVADDAYSTNAYENERNLNFHSMIYDFTNQFEFNFLPYIHGSSNDFFTPYLFGGITIFHYNPRTSLNGKTYNLREYGTEGQPIGEEYYEFGVALPVGFGLKWDINHKLSINLEVSYKFTFTDYLDDVSTSYPNVGELNSLRGEIGVALSDRSGIPGFAEQGKQRGNSRDKDKYSFTGISVMYFFGQLACPEINKYN